MHVVLFGINLTTFKSGIKNTLYYIPTVTEFSATLLNCLRMKYKHTQTGINRISLFHRAFPFTILYLFQPIHLFNTTLIQCEIIIIIIIYFFILFYFFIFLFIFFFFFPVPPHVLLGLCGSPPLAVAVV
jgi:hypothetical protein